MTPLRCPTAAPRLLPATLLLLAVSLAGCSDRVDVEAPPRSALPPDLPERNSTIEAPVALSLDDLQATLDKTVPRRLWQINEQHDDCIPAQHFKALGGRIRITPKVGCRIVGDVERGAITLSGHGKDLRLRLPVRATLAARNIGGVALGKTATGSADVIMAVKLGVRRDWSLNADVTLSYDWRDPPGIDFLGQRITLTSRADRELAKIRGDLQREIERKLATANLRALLERTWQKGFAVVSVNDHDPAVWTRLTPLRLGYQGYDVIGQRLIVKAAVEARTETFVDEKRPEPAKPTPLPPRSDLQATDLSLTVPVIADYAELQPVVLRALRKRAGEGITLAGIGAVDAEFKDVIIYATEGQRLAVGIKAEVKPVRQALGAMGKTKGVVWLTGVPYNEPGSQVVSVRGLAIYGGTNGVASNLLTKLLADPLVVASIQTALVEDFGKDYTGVIADARRAVADLHTGDLRIAMTLDDITHGRIVATGEGLFLPVTAHGTARLSLDLK